MKQTAYTAREIIELLGMVPHQEGGWYAFVTTSGVSLPAGFLKDFKGARDTCSIIYYLLQKGEISRWHQLLASEVWAWHMGGSLEILEQGERPQILAPASQWQTTRLVEGDYALVSCIVAPAFRDEDCLLPPEPLKNEIYR